MDKAISRFNLGFNCSQAVLAEHAEKLGLDEKLALKLATAFGGGICRTDQICGAVSGAYMVIGLKFGNFNPEDFNSKEKTSEFVSEFNRRFLEEHKSVMCSDILECNISTKEGLEKAIEDGLFTGLCPKVVDTASSIINKLFVNT